MPHSAPDRSAAEAPARGMSVAQYARASGLGRTTVYERIRAGALEHRKDGSRLVILEDPGPGVGDAPYPTSGPYTVAEFAHACGVTNSTVYRWIESGKVRHGTRDGTVVVTSGVHDDRPRRGFEATPERGMAVRDYAKARGVSDSAVRYWVSRGLVEHESVGGRRVVLSPVDAPLKRSTGRSSPRGPAAPAPEGYSTVGQTAERLGVPEQTVRGWVARRTAEVHRAEGRVFIPRDWVPETPIRPEGLTVSEFAEATGANPSTVRQWAREGKVASTKIGRTHYITTDPASVQVTRNEFVPADFTPERGMAVSAFAAACKVPYNKVLHWVKTDEVEHKKVGGRHVVLSDPADFQPFTCGVRLPAFARQLGVSNSAVHDWARKGLVQTETVRGKVYATGLTADRPQPGWLTVEEYAKQHGVSPETVHGWIRGRRIRGVDWNGRKYVVSGPRHLAPGTGWLNVAAFARKHGVGTRTVHAWVREGLVSTETVLGRRYITSGPPRRKPEPGWLTTTQFARACGVDLTTVLGWVRDGTVEHERTATRTATRTYVISDPERFRVR